MFCWHAVTATSTAARTNPLSLLGSSCRWFDLHNLAATHLERTPILVMLQRSKHPPYSIGLQFALMTKQGVCDKIWSKSLPVATASEGCSQGHALTPMRTTLSEWNNAVVIYSCGSLLSIASCYRVACWQFPSFPDYNQQLHMH